MHASLRDLGPPCMMMMMISMHHHTHTDTSGSRSGWKPYGDIINISCSRGVSRTGMRICCAVLRHAPFSTASTDGRCTQLHIHPSVRTHLPLRESGAILRSKLSSRTRTHQLAMQPGLVLIHILTHCKRSLKRAAALPPGRIAGRNETR